MSRQRSIDHIAEYKQVMDSQNGMHRQKGKKIDRIIGRETWWIHYNPVYLQ